MKFKALLFALAGAMIFTASAAEDIVPYSQPEINGRFAALNNIGSERNV